MRLIDADKLSQKSCPFGIRGNCQRCSYTRMISNIPCSEIRLDFLRMIDNAPTVKAISVEWIKRYAKKGGRIANILFPFEIEMMLEDWEEEQSESLE